MVRMIASGGFPIPWPLSKGGPGTSGKLKARNFPISGYFGKFGTFGKLNNAGVKAPCARLQHRARARRDRL